MRSAHGTMPGSASSLSVDDGHSRQGAQVIEMQRRRLLSAMVEVLEAHGYEGATVARICKRASVSRRTFYDLFDDREECFIEAFDLAVDRLSGQVASALKSARKAGSSHSWRERMRSSLIAMLDLFDREPGVARLCLVEALKGGPETLRRRRGVTDALTAAIDEGRREAKAADPPPLTAESLVGGCVAVVQARLQEKAPTPLMELVNPLMGMIVLPYLGPAASRRELAQPMASLSRVVSSDGHSRPRPADPFKDLPIRITFRTMRVLSTIGSRPEASNREIGQASGVSDQGQMSKLLHRLQNAGLIENRGRGQGRGEANVWTLTARGHDVLQAVTV